MVKTKFDLAAIKREYIADQLSNCEISRKYGIPESSIRYHAKTKKWKKTLGKTVREKIQEKLLRAELRDPDVNDTEVVEMASSRGAAVIRSQRGDIKQLRKLETKFLHDLLNDPTKLYITQYQGEIISSSVGIAVTEKCAALNSLANVQHKRIQLERQAFNLNDSDGEEDKISEIKIVGVLPQ